MAAKAAVNASDDYNWTLLHWAAANGHIAAVTALVLLLSAFQLVTPFSVVSLAGKVQQLASVSRQSRWQPMQLSTRRPAMAAQPCTGLQTTVTLQLLQHWYSSSSARYTPLMWDIDNFGCL